MRDSYRLIKRYISKLIEDKAVFVIAVVVVFYSIIMGRTDNVCIMLVSLLEIGLVLALLFIENGKITAPKIWVLIGISAILGLITFTYAHNIFCSNLPDQTTISGRITKISYKLSGKNQIEISTEIGNILINAQEDDFNVGEFVLLNGYFYEPDGARNPGQFDYAKYLRNKGIYRGFSGEIKKLPQKESGFYFIFNVLNRFSYQTKEEVFKILDVSDDDKAYFAAIFFGDTSLLDNDSKSEFKLANCSHILAVSGTHYMGFLMGIIPLLSAIKFKNNHKRVIYIFICLMLGTLTGWTESVTRAAVMSICAYCFREFYSGMAFAAIIMIISNPYAALSTGFQLSFCAGLGIKLFSDLYMKWLERIGIAGSISESIASALAAQSGMMPLWNIVGVYISPIHLLCQIIVSLLAQLACGVFIPVVIIKALLTSMLGVSASFTVFPVSLLIKIMRFLIKVTALFAPKSFYTSRLMTHLVLAIFVVLLINISFGAIRRALIHILFAVVAIIVGSVIYGWLFPVKARVVVLDVGQGNSCLIMTNQGTCLIDGGVFDQGTVIRDVLDYYGIERVDYVIGTHWDADHFAGIGALYQLNRVGCLYNSYNMLNPDTLNFVTEYFEIRGSEAENFITNDIKALRQGDVLNISDEVCLRVISPIEVNNGGNEDSLVLCLEINNSCQMLFTGDIGIETEENIIDSIDKHQSSILMVGHHGSRYSTGDRLLEHLKPQIALISAGKHNNYGHPHSETLTRLNEYGCPYFITYESGAVLIDFYRYDYEITSMD